MSRPATGRRWIDATLPIAPDSVAWTGLAPPRLTWDALRARGDSVDVGRLDCSLHTGTHADAPRHVVDGGATAEALDPQRYVGAARVVRVDTDGAIDRAALRESGLRERDLAAGRVERLLLRTPRPYDGRAFPRRIPCLAPDAAAWLAACGVRLVGVDVPSVDPLDSRALETHRVLFGAGVAILENLALAGVAPGDYELVAAPLAVVGGDAAPVRALLRPV